MTATARELELAARHLGVDARRVSAMPIAAIIGEAPGPNTSPRRPMFPLPSRSAGGRLLAYSGLTPAQYLGRFVRRNLFSAILPWSKPEAEDRAAEVLEWLRRSVPHVRRIVLLGGRVGAAFGMGELWDAGSTSDGVQLVTIPHPSGKNRVYNDEGSRRKAGATIRWAAGYRSTRP